MVLHIVMLKPKSGATDEEIQAILEHVQELQPKIPGLLEVRAGKNIDNPDSQGYTHGFVMQFIDEARMKSYFITPQPDHQAVGDELKRICSYVAFDVPYLGAEFRLHLIHIYHLMFGIVLPLRDHR